MMDLKGIKNIIFDFGGVIINIDFRLTINAFKKLGFVNIEEAIFKAEGSEILLQMEKGIISHADFYDEIRRISNLSLTNFKIEEAWNKLLLDIPRKRIKILEKIKSDYRIFLLSNTNSIHYKQYRLQLQDKFGYPDYNYLFEKAWFSFNLGLVKPDKDIFQFVLKDAGLNPEETLYIDDLKINVDAAVNEGMKGYNIEPGEDISTLF